MTIIFWSKIAGNWFAVEHATKLEKRKSMNNGRCTNFWFVYFGNGKSRAYKCIDYDLSRVESY